jgi:parvulin-like peptidyl-prolyl isomerase
MSLSLHKIAPMSLLPLAAWRRAGKTRNGDRWKEPLPAAVTIDGVQESHVSLIINGQQVQDGVVEGEFAQIKSYFERLGNVSCCERDEEFRGYARENVIARVLLSQEAARRFGRLPSDQVDAAMRKLEESHGGQACLLAALGAPLEDLELVRQDVEADLRVRRMIDALCDAAGSPDEQELRRYYAEHPTGFLTPEEMRASHILKSPRGIDERKKAHEVLRIVRQQLLAGADFEELARQHSDKASEHIDFGFFKRGELPEEVESVAFSSAVGEVSPIFLSAYGYHLIKVTDRKPPMPRPFEEVRSEIRDRLLAERRTEVTRKLAAELKERATIRDLMPRIETPIHAHVQAT